MPPKTASPPARPQTPPPGPRLPHAVISTPARGGSSSHAASDGFQNLLVDTVLPWVRKDIVDHHQCRMQDMLGAFLKRCLDKQRDQSRSEILAKCLKTVLPICNDSQVRYYVTEYTKHAEKEQTRYPRFVLLFNLILEKLGRLQTKTAGSGTLKALGLRSPDEDEIMFHCSDPTEIPATHNNLENKRKPDIGIVPLEHARTRLSDDCLDYDWYAVSKGSGSKPESPFQWDHFFSVLEFKLTENTVAQPPSQYTEALRSDIPAIQNVNHLSPKNEALNQKKKIRTASAPKPKPTAAEDSPDPWVKLKAKVEASALTPVSATKSPRDIRMEKRLGSGDAQGSTAQVSKPSPAPSSTSKVDRDDQNLKQKPPVLQNAMYGTEMLCRGIYATHAITILVTDEMAWIWWFDRQGAIQTTGIDFIQDLPYFVALLVAFQRFNKADWGIIEKLYKPSGYDENKSITTEMEVGDKIIVADHLEPFSSHYSLVGRGTHVLLALGAGVFNEEKESYHKGKPLSEIALAVKLCWPEATRQNEAEIIQKALSIDSDNTRGHLPNLIASDDIGCLTADIRLELGISPSPDSPHSGSRLLRVLLLEGLVPNDKWRAPATFMRLWVEWYQCHHVLWANGIEHGDISLGNLMVNPRTEMGVLNDFDLAVLAGVRIFGGERTGTVPFMARELLTREYYDGKVERRYRHDLESFIWVLVIVTLEQSASYEGSLKKWQTGDYNTCRAAKTDFSQDFKHDVRQEEGVDQSQRELTKALVKWLVDRRNASGPPYIPFSDHSEEDLDHLRRFEDVVAEFWSPDWPTFKRLTTFMP